MHVVSSACPHMPNQGFGAPEQPAPRRMSATAGEVPLRRKFYPIGILILDLHRQLAICKWEVRARVESAVFPAVPHLARCCLAAFRGESPVSIGVSTHTSSSVTERHLELPKPRIY